jgi:tetratricopeptide (TPR) repeat protein
MAHLDRRNWDAASAVLEEAFVRADRLRDTTMLGTVALNRAELYLKCDDYDRAHECCDVGFEISSRLGLRSMQAEAHKYYGILYRETAKPQLAAFHLGVASDLACAAEDRLLEAETAHEHALLLLNEAIIRRRCND